MKDEDLFEFYLRKRPDAVGPKNRFWEILKSTPPQALFQLRNLCDRNEKCMVDVICHLVDIPADRELDPIFKEARRTKNIKAFKKNKREEQKLTKEFIKAADILSRYDRTIDLRKALELAIREWDRNVGRHMVVQISKLASRPSQDDILFNETICEIYKVARRASNNNTDNYIFENMAKLLTSLKLKTKAGGEYRRNNIYNIVKRGSLRPATKFLGPKSLDK